MDRKDNVRYIEVLGKGLSAYDHIDVVCAFAGTGSVTEVSYNTELETFSFLAEVPDDISIGDIQNILKEADNDWGKVDLVRFTADRTQPVQTTNQAVPYFLMDELKEELSNTRVTSTLAFVNYIQTFLRVAQDYGQLDQFNTFCNHVWEARKEAEDD